MPKIDLGSFLDDDTLTYEHIPSPEHPGGKTYRVPSVDARTGLKLQQFVEAAGRALAGEDVDPGRLRLDDEQEKDLYRLCLGPVYDEMVGDGVSWLRLKAIGQHAFVYFAVGDEAAARSVARQDPPVADPEASGSAESPKDGSNSNPESGDIPVLPRGRTSTRSSKTSETAAQAV